jgi:hypothetical protein
MTDLKKFINELLTLEIRTTTEPLNPKGIKYLSVAHYNANSSYNNILYTLRNDAMADIKNLPIDQCKNQLKNLETIQKRFDTIFLRYHDLCNLNYAGKRIDKTEINMRFDDVFIIPPYDYNPVHYEFTMDLSEAISSKSSYLEGFIYEVKEFLGVKKNETTYPKNANKPVIGSWIAPEIKRIQLNKQWKQKNLVSDDIFIPGQPAKWQSSERELISKVKELLKTPKKIKGTERDYIKVILANFLRSDGSTFDRDNLKRNNNQMKGVKKWS